MITSSSHTWKCSLVRALGGLLLATIAACSGADEIVRAKAPSLTSVQLAPPDLSLHVTETGQVSATLVGPGAGTGLGAIDYSSSAPAIASVSGSGLVTALAPGNATITAIGTHPATTALIASSVTSTAMVSVTALPNALTDLVVTPSTPTVAVGRSVQLFTSVSTLLASVTWTCTYQSSSDVTAAVTDSGVVTGVTPGTVLIAVTCSGMGAGVTANTLVRTVSVTVVPPPVATVVVTASVEYLQPGPGSGRTSTTLAVTVRDAAGNLLTGRPVAWSSSNPAVASVNASGVASALAIGRAVIVATTEDISDSVAINVVRAFGAVEADQPTVASYQSGVNSAGRANTIVRTAVGQYTVTFPDLGTATIGRSFVFMANAMSGAPNGALTSPTAVCDITDGSDGTPVTLTVRCEHPVTGAHQDAEFRAVLIGDFALDGPHVFSQHTAGRIAPYQPSAAFAFNSAGAPMTIIPNAAPGTFNNLLVRHAPGLSFVPQTAIVHAVPSGPWEACSLDFIGFNESNVNVACYSRTGAVIDRSHVVLRLVAGRPGRGGALTLLLPDGSNTNQGFQSSGSVLSARTGVGKFTVTYAGLSASTSAFFVSANPWLHAGVQCAHRVVTGAPLTVEVACFDGSGAFSDAFGALQVLVLQ